ncbi:TetR/AcrR family transcriptional regulator [Mycobacterium montefiorense]|uniref:Transcriptional regulator, TetR family protein n=1 Tax=Mycobacterium montefiorense TaxID=154654 RepID=A0AA37PVC2_9MYCO|nr:TetR/AcrR family transcriptional regulator [Mycobacterium montefiorense]GBG36681.1 putative transcriptional regulator, TetR family protein [Mycobacterium montefiorense]GKU37031.1 putative transcriptional regulator, TetR family protein [Mycobacterium montefiorense]GKU43064.1 putative transcriptional regulator, TetR family protein [Mycobacterium montefiorense]GKU48625.1 putative transcriptional regulator, TetR family protein [Mycobacterium montefiorense]GKU50655.1 putative transcriptional reg
MPRVVKHPDVRRAEILDRAVALFVARGYDNVSLNDLIADAGVSKGAFYHWFPSKDALITTLAERSARSQLAAIERAAAGCDGNALDRLNALLQAGFDVKMQMGTPEQLAAMVSLLRPGNAHLYGRIIAVSEGLTRPLLTRLIADGVAEGVFHTFDPEGVADMIQGLAARINSNVVQIIDATDEPGREKAIEILANRFKLHGLAVDRVLGLPDGSVTALSRAQVEIMVAALPRDY